MDKFFTVHEPHRHSAHPCLGPNGAVFGTQLPVLVPPQPTEIELARELSKLGVDLKQFDYHSRGDERFLTTVWERKAK